MGFIPRSRQQIHLNRIADSDILLQQFVNRIADIAPCVPKEFNPGGCIN